MSRIPPQAARLAGAWPSSHEPRRRGARTRRPGIVARVLHPLSRPVAVPEPDAAVVRRAARPARPA